MYFYKQLNGLRFIFILMVLLQHWGPHRAFEHFHLAWLGVNLFFVLSGFLIGEILLKEKESTANRWHSIKNFITRRALRIFPLYYIAIIVFALIIGTGGILIWNLTYTNNIISAIDISKVPKVYWHLWSLCVEEQFYIFFPFILFFINNKSFRNIIIAGILLSVLGRYIFVWKNIGDYHHITYSLMPFCLDCLFAGVLLAYLKNYHTVQTVALFNRRLLINFLILLAAVYTFATSLTKDPLIDNTFFRFGGALLGFFVIGYATMAGFRGLARMFLESRIISFLGKISYGIYLLHPFVEKLYYQYIGENGVKNFLVHLNKPVVSNRYVIDFALLFLLTVTLAICSFQLIEKRFLKLKLLYK